MPATVTAHTTIHEFPRDHPLHGRGSLMLWLANLVSPAGWLLAQSFAYMRVERSCTEHSTLAMQLITITGLALIVAGGVSSFILWRRLGGGWPRDISGPSERGRFMAVVGTLSSLLFAAIVIAQWAGTAILPPCV